MEDHNKENQLDDSLVWEEVHMEHIVQDEWIDFRRSAWKFPDGSVFEPFYSYSQMCIRDRFIPIPGMKTR